MPKCCDAGSDEALMEAYLAGDHWAFRQLFVRYRRPLHRLMRRAVRDAYDAEELVQQTFLQLHRARGDFARGELVRPWLYTIAINVRHQHVRRVMRHQRKVAALAAERSERVRPPPDHLLLRAVRLAVSGLPAGQRKVVELHWFSGLSFREIAAQLGATPVAVRIRAHRGYERLRDVLG
jgi:RNA polymerase sigma-70 factor (ECF subfamily)